MGMLEQKENVAMGMLERNVWWDVMDVNYNLAIFLFVPN